MAKVNKEEVTIIRVNIEVNGVDVELNRKYGRWHFHGLKDSDLKKLAARMLQADESRGELWYHHPKGMKPHVE